MIAFWVVAGVLAAAAAGLILSRASRAAALSEPADPARAVYKRQLAEIDELAERGLIAERERASARAEAARRLLGAADAPATPWGPDARARGAILITAIGAPLTALVLYIAVGQPGMRDEPFTRRLAAWRAADPATLSPAQLAAVLQQLTRDRPNDPEGFRYLAIAEGAAQDPAEAVRALRHAIQLAPQRADLWELLGEALVAENDGQVTPDAQAVFREAVKRDPKAFAARFHLARAKIAAGDRAGGLADWRALLADMPASDSRRDELQAAIAQEEAGPKAAGPAMPQNQMALIQSMVSRLADRLKTNPDDPEGWVRLVRAYAVLGEDAKRDQALGEARRRYAGRSDILTRLDQAAHAERMK